jgi:hypothetical protein
MSLEKRVEYGWLRREATSPAEITDLLGIGGPGARSAQAKAPTLMQGDDEIAGAQAGGRTAITGQSYLCSVRSTSLISRLTVMSASRFAASR